MKKSLLLLAVMTSFSAFAAEPSAVTDIRAEAANIAKEAQDRYENGLSAGVDVDEAAAYLARLDLAAVDSSDGFDAKEIATCDNALDKTRKAYQATDVSVKVGVRTVSDVLARLNELKEVQKTCIRIK